MTDPDPGCGGHPGLTTELKALAAAALDRLTPLLDRVRAEPATAVTATTCAGCPVCAVLAAVRGERPELAVRLAEHAAGLLLVLRTALDEEDPPTPPEPAGRPVQRIPVERVATHPR